MLKKVSLNKKYVFLQNLFYQSIPTAGKSKILLTFFPLNGSFSKNYKQNTANPSYGGGKIKNKNVKDKDPNFKRIIKLKTSFKEKKNVFGFFNFNHPSFRSYNPAIQNQQSKRNYAHPLNGQGQPSDEAQNLKKSPIFFWSKNLVPFFNKNNKNWPPLPAPAMEGQSPKFRSNFPYKKSFFCYWLLPLMGGAFLTWLPGIYLTTLGYCCPTNGSMVIKILGSFPHFLKINHNARLSKYRQRPYLESLHSQTTSENDAFLKDQIARIYYLKTPSLAGGGHLFVPRSGESPNLKKSYFFGTPSIAGSSQTLAGRPGQLNQALLGLEEGAPQQVLSLLNKRECLDGALALAGSRDQRVPFKNPGSGRNENRTKKKKEGQSNSLETLIKKLSCIYYKDLKQNIKDNFQSMQGETNFVDFNSQSLASLIPTLDKNYRTLEFKKINKKKTNFPFCFEFLDAFKNKQSSFLAIWLNSTVEIQPYSGFDSYEFFLKSQGLRPLKLSCTDSFQPPRWPGVAIYSVPPSGESPKSKKKSYFEPPLFNKIEPPRWPGAAIYFVPPSGESPKSKKKSYFFLEPLQLKNSKTISLLTMNKNKNQLRPSSKKFPKKFMASPSSQILSQNLIGQTHCFWANCLFDSQNQITKNSQKYLIRARPSFPPLLAKRLIINDRIERDHSTALNILRSNLPRSSRFTKVYKRENLFTGPTSKLGSNLDLILTPNRLNASFFRAYNQTKKPFQAKPDFISKKDFLDSPPCDFSYIRSKSPIQSFQKASIIFNPFSPQSENTKTIFTKFEIHKFNKMNQGFLHFFLTAPVDGGAGARLPLFIREKKTIQKKTKLWSSRSFIKMGAQWPPLQVAKPLRNLAKLGSDGRGFEGHPFVGQGRPSSPRPTRGQPARGIQSKSENKWIDKGLLPDPSLAGDGQTLEEGFQALAKCLDGGTNFLEDTILFLSKKNLIATNPFSKTDVLILESKVQNGQWVGNFKKLKNLLKFLKNNQKFYGLQKKTDFLLDLGKAQIDGCPPSPDAGPALKSLKNKSFNKLNKDSLYSFIFNKISYHKKNPSHLNNSNGQGLENSGGSYLDRFCLEGTTPFSQHSSILKPTLNSKKLHSKIRASSAGPGNGEAGSGRNPTLNGKRHIQYYMGPIHQPKPVLIEPIWIGNVKNQPFLALANRSSASAKSSLWHFQNQQAESSTILRKEQKFMGGAHKSFFINMGEAHTSFLNFQKSIPFQNGNSNQLQYAQPKFKDSFSVTTGKEILEKTKQIEILLKKVRSYLYRSYFSKSNDLVLSLPGKTYLDKLCLEMNFFSKKIRALPLHRRGWRWRPWSLSSPTRGKIKTILNPKNFKEITFLLKRGAGSTKKNFPFQAKPVHDSNQEFTKAFKQPKFINFEKLFRSYFSKKQGALKNFKGSNRFSLHSQVLPENQLPSNLLRDNRAALSLGGDQAYNPSKAGVSGETQFNILHSFYFIKEAAGLCNFTPSVTGGSAVDPTGSGHKEIKKARLDFQPFKVLMRQNLRKTHKKYFVQGPPCKRSESACKPSSKPSKAGFNWPGRPARQIFESFSKSKLNTLSPLDGRGRPSILGEAQNLKKNPIFFWSPLAGHRRPSILGEAQNLKKNPIFFWSPPIILKAGAGDEAPFNIKRAHENNAFFNFSPNLFFKNRFFLNKIKHPALNLSLFQTLLIKAGSKKITTEQPLLKNLNTTGLGNGDPVTTWTFKNKKGKKGTFWVLSRNSKHIHFNKIVGPPLPAPAMEGSGRNPEVKAFMAFKDKKLGNFKNPYKFRSPSMAGGGHGAPDKYEAFLKKKIYNARKSRTKTQNKETRRRNTKRKRFFPRPEWLRSEIYSPFIRHRHQLIPIHHLSNPAKLGLAIKGDQLVGLRAKLYRNSNLFPPRWPGATIYFVPPSGESPKSKKKSDFFLEPPTDLCFSIITQPGKDFYEISRPTLSDLRKSFWKSYWLRSNLNSYLKRVKLSLKNLREKTQIYNRPAIKVFKKKEFNFGKRELPSFETIFFQGPKPNGTYVYRLETNLAHNKWHHMSNLAEYRRIISQRIQQTLVNIRGNLNINGQIKARSSKIGHQRLQPLKPIKEFWLKFGKVLSLEIPETFPINFYGDLSRLRKMWTLNKSNYSSFRSINPRKNLWANEKKRFQARSNSSQTKKIIYKMLQKFESTQWWKFFPEIQRRQGLALIFSIQRPQSNFAFEKPSFLQNLKDRFGFLHLNGQRQGKPIFHQLKHPFHRNQYKLQKKENKLAYLGFLNKKTDSTIQSFLKCREFKFFSSMATPGHRGVSSSQISRKFNQSYFSAQPPGSIARRSDGVALEKTIPLAGRGRPARKPTGSSKFFRTPSMAGGNQLAPLLALKKSYRGGHQAPDKAMVSGNFKEMTFLSKFAPQYNYWWNFFPVKKIPDFQLNLNKNTKIPFFLWIPTFFFHFCAFLFLINVAEIRGLFKFYLLFLSNLLKIYLAMAIKVSLFLRSFYAPPLQSALLMEGAAGAIEPLQNKNQEQRLINKIATDSPLRSALKFLGDSLFKYQQNRNIKNHYLKKIQMSFFEPLDSEIHGNEWVETASTKLNSQRLKGNRLNALNLQFKSSVKNKPFFIGISPSIQALVACLQIRAADLTEGGNKKVKTEPLLNMRTALYWSNCFTSSYKNVNSSFPGKACLDRLYLESPGALKACLNRLCLERKTLGLDHLKISDLNGLGPIFSESACSRAPSIWSVPAMLFVLNKGFLPDPSITGAGDGGPKRQVQNIPLDGRERPSRSKPILENKKNFEIVYFSFLNHCIKQLTKGACGIARSGKEGPEFSFFPAFQGQKETNGQTKASSQALRERLQRSALGLTGPDDAHAFGYKKMDKTDNLNFRTPPEINLNSNLAKPERMPILSLFYKKKDQIAPSSTGPVVGDHLSNFAKGPNYQWQFITYGMNLYGNNVLQFRIFLAYQAYWFCSKNLQKSVDIFQEFIGLIYMFFEKPGEVFAEWITFSFLIDCSSDLITLVPESQDLLRMHSFSKISRAMRPLLISYPFRLDRFNFFKNAWDFDSFLFSLPLSSGLFHRRILHMYETVIEKWCQPDADLIIRQKKGMIFWDLWSEILINVAEDETINLSELTSLKEEQNRLLEKLEDYGFQDLNLTGKTCKSIHVRVRLRDPEAVPGASFLPSAMARASWPGVRRPPPANEGAANYILGLHRSKSKKNKIFFRFRADRWPLKKYIFLDPASEEVQSATTNRTFSKYFSGSDRRTEAIFLSDFEFQGSAHKKRNHGLFKETSSKKSVNQFLSYQGKDTELFIQKSPPKSFSDVPSIKYSQSSQQPIATIVCQIFSGIFTEKISKNILVVGSSGKKNEALFIQAIAGESELKIIVDNAQRYTMVQSGVALGIKLLKDVFEALSFQPPCIFLLEDVHHIGGRRPLLLSDQAAIPEGDFGSNKQAPLDEKNQVTYELSNHLISHYKKPYKGDFSLLIPTNHFCFNLFLGISSPQIRTNKIPLTNPINSEKINQQSVPNNQMEMLDKNAGSSEEIFMQNISTSLQLQSNHLLAPPATSPFSILLLKEDNTLKSNQILKEIPPHLAVEKLALLSKSNSSMRVKIACLADLALAKVSVKLDLITDFLVIVDSVKGNRGFVVFATTHVPYILDPALRRPGRFDETISLSLIPNLLNRWEILKRNLGNLINPSRYSSFSKGVSLNLSNFSFHSTNIYQMPGFANIYKQSLKMIAQADVKSPTLCYDSNSRDYQNYGTLSFHLRMKQPPRGPGVAIEPQNLNDPNGLINPFQISKYKKSTYQNQIVALKLLTGGSMAAPGQQGGSKKISAPLLAGFRGYKGNDFEKKQTHPYLNFIFKNLIGRTYFYSSQVVTSLFDFRVANHPFSIPATDFFLFNATGPNEIGLTNMYLSLYPSSKTLKTYITNLLAGKLGEHFLFSIPNYNKLHLDSNGSPLLSPALIKLREEVKISEAKINRSAIKKSKAQKRESQGSYQTPTSTGPAMEAIGAISGIGTASLLFARNGIDKTWRSATSLLFSILTKRYLYNKNLIIPKLFYFSNFSSLNEPPVPPTSNLLLPLKRYENYRRTFYSEQIQNKATFQGKTLQEPLELHQQQRFVKRLYKVPLRDFFKSEVFKNKFTGFANSLMMLSSVEKQMHFSTNINWYYRNRILNRHKNYLKNQWWNGQLSEHNIESTFLSEIDWRSTFVESIGDISIDFPDSDQFYNVQNRRWILTSMAWENWLSFEKTNYSSAINQYLFDCFIKAYKSLDQSREILDSYAFNCLNESMLKSPSEVTIISLFKRFYKIKRLSTHAHL